MKRLIAATTATCAVILLLMYAYHYWISPPAAQSTIRVGFVFDGDESISYTYNFSLARDELKQQYGDRVEILTRSNVLEDQTEDSLRELVQSGCGIIFLNGYSPQVIEVAKAYPEVQFCQASYKSFSGQTVPENYHSFKGEAFQARYVTGVAAGMALRQLIDQGELQPDQALVGYVAAFLDPEVISGYTAFLMGVRSVAPEAVMRVRCTETWSSFSREKQAAAKLLEEGCIVISQHTDTIGPALACEEAAKTRTVYHVGYNQSMLSFAPSSALIAGRIDWAPYVTGAVSALEKGQRIEKAVSGTEHGNDMSAGFDQGWVDVIGLNTMLAAPGTQEKLNEVIAQFRRGRKNFAFAADVTAVSAEDPSVTISLKDGYTENAASSYPSFYYLLPDLITIE